MSTADWNSLAVQLELEVLAVLAIGLLGAIVSMAAGILSDRAERRRVQEIMRASEQRRLEWEQTLPPDLLKRLKQQEKERADADARLRLRPDGSPW
jgi:uncharacterized membrane protein (DUF106 family)